MTPQEYVTTDDYVERKTELIVALGPFDLALRRMPHPVSEYSTTIGGLLLALPVDQRRAIVEQLNRFVRSDLH